MKGLNLKSCLIGFIFGISLTSVGVFATQYTINNNKYPILVDGQKKDVNALNINDSTYINLRSVSQVVNAKVNFNNNTQPKQIEINTNKEVSPINTETPIPEIIPEVTPSPISMPLTTPIPHPKLNIKLGSETTDNNGIIYVIGEDSKKYTTIDNFQIWCSNNKECRFSYKRNLITKTNTFNITGKNIKSFPENKLINIFDSEGTLYIEYDFIINNILPNLN